MKTILPKALVRQGESMKEAYYTTTLASTKNSAKLDALEICLKSLTEEIKMLAEDMRAFTRLFKLSSQRGMNIVIDIPAEDTNAPVGQR